MEELHEKRRDMAIDDIVKSNEIKMNIYLKMMEVIASGILTSGLMFFAGVQVLIAFPQLFTAIIIFWIGMFIILIVGVSLQLYYAWDCKNNITDLLIERANYKLKGRK